MKKILAQINNDFYLILVAAAFVILIFSNLTFLTQGQNYLGYDFGFYHGMAKAIEASGNKLSADLQDKGSVEGVILIFKLFDLVGFDVSDIIPYLYLLFNFLIALVIYYLVSRDYSQSAAAVSVMFYALSLTQFEALGYMLWRQNLAILFLALILYFLPQKQIICLPIILFLAVLHLPTFFLALVVYLIYALLKKNYRALLASLLILPLIIIYLLNSASALDAFWSVVKAPEIDIHRLSQGSFLSLSQYLIYGLFFLVLGLGQVWKNCRQKKIDPATLLFIVLCLIVFLRLIFYRRFIAYLDFAAIILAGPYFIYLAKKFFPKFEKIVIILLLVFLSIINLNVILSHEPLISESDLASIKQIKNQTENDALVMTINSAYAPWLEGFADRPVISPGLLRDKWSYEQWQIFWDNQDESAILNQLNVYQKPLYIFLGEQDFFTLNQNCFKAINRNLYQYVCD